MEQTRDPNSHAIGVVRIVVGIFFVVMAEYKVFGTQFTLQGGFANIVASWVKGETAYPFMLPILKAILAHCATPMSFAVAYGEMLIGISLVIGVFARVASVFGFLLMISIWLSAGYPRGGQAPFWVFWASSLSWTILATCFAALAIGRPDEIWSLTKVRRLRQSGRRAA